jgi:hypothetical protein
VNKSTATIAVNALHYVIDLEYMSCRKVRLRAGLAQASHLRASRHMQAWFGTGPHDAHLRYAAAVIVLSEELRRDLQCEPQ